MPNPHLFMQDSQGDCLWCPLPEQNRIHNARPTTYDKRKRTVRYADKQGK